ncbi:MAG: hypothetical protein PUP91_37070 [Rhizonema sp. PD37]|nr:hypothetical protein [Rhizonema sp. PD37]
MIFPVIVPRVWKNLFKDLVLGGAGLIERTHRTQHLTKPARTGGVE